MYEEHKTPPVPPPHRTLPQSGATVGLSYREIERMSYIGSVIGNNQSTTSPAQRQSFSQYKNQASQRANSPRTPTVSYRSSTASTSSSSSGYDPSTESVITSRSQSISSAYSPRVSHDWPHQAAPHSPSTASHYNQPQSSPYMRSRSPHRMSPPTQGQRRGSNQSVDQPYYQLYDPPYQPSRYLISEHQQQPQPNSVYQPTYQTPYGHPYLHQQQTQPNTIQYHSSTRTPLTIDTSNTTPPKFIETSSSTNNSDSVDKEDDFIIKPNRASLLLQKPSISPTSSVSSLKGDIEEEEVPQTPQTIVTYHDDPRLSSDSSFSEQMSTPRPSRGRMVSTVVEEDEETLRPLSSSSEYDSPSTPSTPSRPQNSLDFPRPHPLLSQRKSSESLRVFAHNRGGRAAGERSQSFSYGSDINSMSSRSSGHSSPASPSVKSKTPIVYPALLSKVAEAFKQRITLQTRIKDGLEFKDCFDGREAVDKIAYIIKTTDRNLALLLGRALDAQKFFHDVNYEHRLRDSQHELYQFRERIASPMMGLSGSDNQMDTIADDTESVFDVSDQEQLRQIAYQTQREEEDLPNGVFTLLTDCYSPTCTRDKLCYSIACPRRLEQQARLSMTADSGLKRWNSRSSLHEKDQRLWIHSVPKEIADTVSSEERKRQENIFELIYTEKDFVSDLEYVRDYWMVPLSTDTEILPETYRDDFIKDVYFNILEIHAVNERLSEALQIRQNAYAIVDRIGDIMEEHVINFEPFVWYGAHQMEAKYYFEFEKNRNSALWDFVEEVERQPRSRKLELNGYLTKPTTRLGRYNLLLKEILKHTPEGHPDRETIPKVMEIIHTFLTKVNVETGKAENRFSLDQLTRKLSFKPGTEMDLKLYDENRLLILKGILKKKGTGSESSDLQVFLFDHYFLMTKLRYVNKTELFKVHKAPIPLELLSVNNSDSVPAKRTSTIMSGRNAANLSIIKKNIGTTNDLNNDRAGFPLIFTHLGKKGGPPFTLFATTYASRRQWIEKIEKQKREITEKHKVFEIVPLSKRYFTSTNKVNCSVIYDHGRKFVIGTDMGVYVSALNASDQPISRVLLLDRVQQIEILEEARLIMILADKQLHTYPIDVLDIHSDKDKKGRKISSHVSFFKSGVCLDRSLVCIVKSNALTSTIKTLEPQIQGDNKKNKGPSLGRLLRGAGDVLKVYKEFYIPTESTSIHFLKTKLCVGCTKGFEIVDLTSLNTQGLLDPEDESLGFVLRRENVRPIAIYRIQTGEFLLCYDEFAFYVDKNGRRAKHEFLIEWEGTPTGFALHGPYIVAFEPSFIEVRHVATGSLEQIIPGSNIRILNASSAQNAVILAVMDDKDTSDYQYIFQLKLSDFAMQSRNGTAVGHGNGMDRFSNGGW